MELRGGGLESVVKPPAEVVVAGTGVRLAEEGGDLGGDKRVMEERRCRVLGGKEGRRDRSNGRKGLNG